MAKSLFKMNIKNIREIAEIMTAAGLNKLEITEDTLIIKMEKSAPAAPARVEYCAVPPSVLHGGEAVAGSAAVNTSAVNTAAAAAANAASGVSDAGGSAVILPPQDRSVAVKSPVVGVFYSAPAPDAPPYVAIGTEVSRGDVLCIIEVMKQMNEITAETDGVISDICLKSGDVAEFGQTLFKLTVSG